MAAAPDRCAPDIVDLGRLCAGDLDHLLAEEQLAWRSTLSWDFSASADLVRRYLAIHGLTGAALVANGRAVGYCYYVCENRKGVVGDLYVQRDWTSPENEDRLLEAVLHSLISTPGVERIEAQLMMLNGHAGRSLPLGRFGAFYPRLLMVADLEDLTRDLPVLAGAGDAKIAPWISTGEEDAARVIAAAYRDHVDASINDQYRTVAGARKFLHNVVHYPGCGSFFGPGSFVALAGSPPQAAGLALSSIVAPEVGHITQICLMPEWKGRGLGYQLLRRSISALAAAGCTKASLTVTAENRQAISLYQNMGFRAVRRFGAYVWEGF